MKSILALPGMAILLSLATMVGGQDRGPSTPSPLVERFGTLPIFFIENRGVFPDEVKYYLHHRDGAILFCDRQVIFRRHASPERDIRLSFVDAHEHLVVRGEERRETVVNYFQGRESDWKTGIPTFGSVVYREVWPGIDLVFRGVSDHVKYEFRVQPGADSSRIRLRYDGIDALRLDAEGALVVESRVETIRDDRPIAYQDIGGNRCEVTASFALTSQSAQEFGFQLGTYDLGNELVIDPATLVYCGYAGSNIIMLWDLAVDQQGNLYVVGSTANTYPSDEDICLMKVSADGSRLEYVVYIRGAGLDCALSVALDGRGFVYLAGYTYSDQKSFPVKVGPDLTFNNPGVNLTDGFVCKLAGNGQAIVYCGYIGGSDAEGATSIALDASQHLWVGGSTNSADFPFKGGPSSTHWPSVDAFVCRVKPDGTGLAMSGYLGGWYDDYILDLAVDGQGDAYVSGGTRSSEKTFPVKVGPDLTYNYHTPGWSMDVFVAKIKALTGQIEYCGYVGGNGIEWGGSIAVDGNGCAYVVGATQSDETSFPIKTGPFLKGTLGFAVKVNAQGTGFVYSGMIPNGQGLDVAVDSVGNAYVTGVAGTSLPVTNCPTMRFGGGSTDAYVAKIPASGKGFTYCGYVGGATHDAAHALALDARGNVYICGDTLSTEATFPVKVGPGLVYNGSANWRGQFVAKIAETALTATGTPRVGGTVILALLSTNDAGLPYQVGSSLGTGPIPIDTRKLDLTPDGLLAVSVSAYWPTIFSNYRGVIDSKGQARAAIHIPNIPALIGVRLHSAFVTLDPAAPSGIRSISNTFSFSVTK